MEYDNILSQADKICRTCLNVATDRKSLLYILDGNNRSLRDILAHFTNTDINMSEKYPNQVCTECCDMLYKAETFKKQCIQSENILSKLLSDEKKTVKKELLHNTECNEIYKYEVELIKIDKTLESEPNILENRNEPLKINLWDSVSSNENLIATNCKPVESCDENILSVSKQEKIDEFLQNNLEITYQFDSPSHDYTSDIETPISFEDMKGIQKTEHKQLISNKCPKCDLNFSSFNLLEVHILKHKKDINIVVEKLQCSLCAREFKSKKSLTKHIKRHEMRNEVSFKCKTCKRDFQHKAHLDNHILSVHTKKDGYTCEICNTSFSTEDSLNTHKESHSIEKMHQCKTCGKAFIMLSTLTDHLRTHTGEKPFLCSICGRGFSQNTNLKQHMRRHMGIKPFKCEQCERGFVSKGELVAHQRKHSGAHPFVCDDCGNGFTTSSSLGKHRRIHTGERPYACDLCSMRFNASGTLKNHRRTHTGEKPFQCSHCEKAFVQRQDLVSHIRCHTGERPFICPSCGQAFRKASALKAHVKIHVKESLQRDVSMENLQGVNMILNGI